MSGVPGTGRNKWGTGTTGRDVTVSSWSTSQTGRSSSPGAPGRKIVPGQGNKGSHEDLQPLRNLIDGGVKFSAEELEEFSAMRTKAESDAAHQKAQHEYYGEAVSGANANQAAARAEAFQQLAQLLAN